MTPQPWAGFARGLAIALLQSLLRRGRHDDEAPPWQRAARRRRAALLWAVVGSTAIAVDLLLAAEPGAAEGTQALQTGLFALLFAWVAAGFFTAMMGFVCAVRGDRHALRLPTDGAPIAPGARTAVLMPICNEDIATVFGGLRAICSSLQATGQAPLFDVFVLSDTRDGALRAQELQAVAQLRAELRLLDGAARVFYRWRRRRSKRKAGNVADFCRRWGRDYRYMAVLDADSVMSGDCLVSLVRLMEAHPRAGIVQTAPRSCGHDTLHARAQSFLSRVTGPMFTRGLAYWQLGESHYWGHNAILRVEPFMRHCGLAPLPGRGGLSGEILSHDFVEAALMRRAGYEVWLAPDLDGSFEQPPTQLLDELQRDRRWCQGNLQNARLAAEPGLRGVHRAMFITGALSYLASPLWLAFVIVSAWHAAHGHATAVGSMVVSHPLLWAMVLAMLFLPRVLGVLHVMAQRQQHLFGGTAGLWGGAALEALLSALQAPVRMAAHTLFVLVALTGLKLDWKSPSRASAVLRWSEAAAGLRWLMLPLLLAAAVVAASGNSGLAMSLAPMLLPLLLSLPLAVVGSQRVVGRALRRQGLLTIPEEAAPPPVLRHAWRQVKTLRVHERQQERARQQHLPAGGALPAPALPALAFAGLAEAAQRQAAGAGAHGLRANGLRAHGLRANGLRALVAGAAVAMLALFTPTPPGTATLHGPDMEAELWRHIQLERFAKLQAESLQPVMQKASLSSKRKGVRRAAMTPATLPAAEPAAAAVTKL